MVISKEILTDYKEVYEKAIKLVNDESKNDPPTDPYRSHYDAKELLLQLKEKLNSALQSMQAEEADNSDDYFTLKVILAFTCRDLGRIYVFTEEGMVGETHMQDCLELMEPYKLRAEAIIPYVGALNEMGIVQANRRDYPKAFQTLSKAETVYNEFKLTGLKAKSITDVFGTQEEIEEGKGPMELEGVYTLCTFYLAQVYGHLGDLAKSAKMCNITLRRQLAGSAYEPIDFALNAATLSQYYIKQSMFKEARHHLAAATLVMTNHEKRVVSADMSEQQASDNKETFKHRFADVARCWAKYGLALLSASKERLYNDDEQKIAADTTRLAIDPKSYRFETLNLTGYEDRISADYCLTFDDAKLVYHFVINWLDQAKEYYKADTEATEYAKIIKDYAELYQHIAFFEEDPVNQAKMQKRRAKYYEELLDLLNPVFYMVICRECWYGAGLSYCAILDIKLDAFNANHNPTTQDVKKINQVCDSAIKHFKEFIKSYMEKDGVTMKANMDCEEQRTVIYAYFHLGRLNYKMITADQNIQLENMTNSLKYYKLFIDECEARKQPAETLKAEIGVCREMTKLLPLKIENLKKRLIK